LIFNDEEIKAIKRKCYDVPESSIIYDIDCQRNVLDNYNYQIEELTKIRDKVHEVLRLKEQFYKERIATKFTRVN
jgi:hypothetical protein